MKKSELNHDTAIARFKKQLDSYSLDELLGAKVVEPKCNICGRVIHSGVSSSCDKEPCGLKQSGVDE